MISPTEIKLSRDETALAAQGDQRSEDRRFQTTRPDLSRRQAPTNPATALGGAAEADVRGRPQGVPRLRPTDEDDRDHHACRRGERDLGRPRSADRSALHPAVQGTAERRALRGLVAVTPLVVGMNR